MQKWMVKLMNTTEWILMMSRSNISSSIIITSRHTAIQLDLLNWFYFMVYLSMVIFFVSYLHILFLSLDSHLFIVIFLFVYICFCYCGILLCKISHRCLNLLAAWIELRFLISSHSSLYASFDIGWNTIFMRIFDS